MTSRSISPFGSMRGMLIFSANRYALGKKWHIQNLAVPQD